MLTAGFWGQTGVKNHLHAGLDLLCKWALFLAHFLNMNMALFVWLCVLADCSSAVCFGVHWIWEAFLSGCASQFCSCWEVMQALLRWVLPTEISGENWAELLKAEFITIVVDYLLQSLRSANRQRNPCKHNVFTSHREWYGAVVSNGMQYMCKGPLKKTLEHQK